MVGESFVGVLETAVSGRSIVGVGEDVTWLWLETAVLPVVAVGSGSEVVATATAVAAGVGVTVASTARISS